MAKSSIENLTPQMAAYSEEFADSGRINWLPYVMYFHPFGYRSEVVNTDRSGFRYSEARGRRYSVADPVPEAGVRVLAGSSTVFGIGASADRHTLASRMTENDDRPEFWVNFGGRSFNSTQEMILFALDRHRLPEVSEIVLFSGFNDLGLSRLPARVRMDHGAFFLCNEFFEAMAGKKPSRFSSWFRGRGARETSEDEATPLEEQIAYAADLTLRNLSTWRAMADGLGARLTFVLQPLANWVRATGSAEEEALFAELEAKGGFAETYGDILEPQAFEAYERRLRAGAAELGVRFINFAPKLAAAITPDQWLFVDRIHFTDAGYDFVSRLLLDVLNSEEAAS